MKKYLLLLIFIIASLYSFGQNHLPNPMPGFQNFGTPQTLTQFSGIAYPVVGFINSNYNDTTSANINPYLKLTPGSQIYTIDGKLWLRNSTATAWVQISTGSSASFTASNGLTMIGNDVQLGGTLTKTDSIITGLHNLNIYTKRYDSTAGHFYVINQDDPLVYTLHAPGVSAYHGGKGTDNESPIIDFYNRSGVFKFAIGYDNGATHGFLDLRDNRDFNIERDGNSIEAFYKLRNGAYTHYMYDILALESGSGPFSDSSYRFQLNEGKGKALDTFYFGGKVGFGTPLPTASVHINGAGGLRYVTGSEGLNKILIGDANGVVSWASQGSFAWLVNGNSGTTSGTNFLGTTDNQALNFRTNNVVTMRLDSLGSRLFLTGGLNPVLSLKQLTTLQEYQIRVGVNTGTSNSGWNLYDATNSKIRLFVNTAGAMAIGNVSVIPLESSLYVNTLNSSGSNIDTRPGDSTISDDANIEAEASNYVNNGRGTAIQYSGSLGTGSSLGYPNTNMAQLRLFGVYNVIRTVDNHSLRFGTNNIEGFVLDSNQRVGIGKQFPTERLDVSGNIRFSGALMPNNTAGTSGQVLTSAGAGSPPTWATATVSTPAGNYGNLQINRNGSFATGALDSITWDGQMLKLKGSSGNKFIELNAGGANNTSIISTSLSNQGIILTGTGGVNNGPGITIFGPTSDFAGIYVYLGSSGQDLVFRNTGGTELARMLSSNGNFGIGDASPASSLTVGSGDLFQVNSSGAIVATTGYIQGSGTHSITSANTTQTTTSSISSVNANSLTSGTGIYAASSSISSGNLLNLVTTGTAAASGNEAFNIDRSGANGTSSITVTGGRISVTNTGTTSTNVGLAITTSGASNNYTLTLVDGTQGAGKVLSSDANGNASWVTPSSSGIAAGTYTVSLTNTANISSSTAHVCQYSSVTDPSSGTQVVTVSGYVTVTPTTTLTDTQLTMSVPITSAFGNIQECGGVAFATAISGQGAGIHAVASSVNVMMQWRAVDVTSQNMWFTFTYKVTPP